MIMVVAWWYFMVLDQGFPRQLWLGPIRMSSADPEAVVTDPTITTVETVVTTQEMDAEQQVWITN